MRLSFHAALMGMAASLLVGAILMAPGAASADDRCVDVVSAVGDWGDQFPNAGDYTDLSNCRNGCNTWHSGCRDSAFQAARCERNAADSQAAMNKAQCRNQPDKESRKICDRIANDIKKTDSDAATDAQKSAYDSCKSAQQICLEACDAFHSSSSE